MTCYKYNPQLNNNNKKKKNQTKSEKPVYVQVLYFYTSHQANQQVKQAKP